MENIWTSHLKMYSSQKLGAQSILKFQMRLKKQPTNPPYHKMYDWGFFEKRELQAHMISHVKTLRCYTGCK